MPDRLATVTVMTSEVALVRSSSAILEPWRRVRAGGPPGASDPKAKGAHVVVMDLDGVDVDDDQGGEGTPIRAQRSSRSLPGAARRTASPRSTWGPTISPARSARPISKPGCGRRNSGSSPRRECPASTATERSPSTSSAAGFEVEGRNVALARSESDLLAHLAGRAGIVVSYERLLVEAGLAGLRRGRPALRSCVMRLRRKIERQPLRPGNPARRNRRRLSSRAVDMSL